MVRLFRTEGKGIPVYGVTESSNEDAIKAVIRAQKRAYSKINEYDTKPGKIVDDELWLRKHTKKGYDCVIVYRKKHEKEIF